MLQYSVFYHFIDRYIIALNLKRGYLFMSDFDFEQNYGFEPNFDRLVLLDRIEECLIGSSINYYDGMVTIHFQYTIDNERVINKMDVPDKIFRNIVHHIKNNKKEEECFIDNKYKYFVEYFNNTATNTKLYEIRKHYKNKIIDTILIDSVNIQKKERKELNNGYYNIFINEDDYTYPTNQERFKAALQETDLLESNNYTFIVSINGEYDELLNGVTHLEYVHNTISIDDYAKGELRLSGYFDEIDYDFDNNDFKVIVFDLDDFDLTDNRYSNIDEYLKNINNDNSNLFESNKTIYPKYVLKFHILEE
jgi:hypothetical protein